MDSLIALPSAPLSADVAGEVGEAGDVVVFRLLHANIRAMVLME